MRSSTRPGRKEGVHSGRVGDRPLDCEPAGVDGADGVLARGRGRGWEHGLPGRADRARQGRLAARAGPGRAVRRGGRERGHRAAGGRGDAGAIGVDDHVCHGCGRVPVRGEGAASGVAQALWTVLPGGGADRGERAGGSCREGRAGLYGGDPGVNLEQVEATAKELVPLAAAGEPGVINRPLLAALAEHGLLGVVFRRDGNNFVPTSAVDLCALREGLARHSTEAETTLAVQGLGAYPILRAGRPELAGEWLPRIAAGEVAAGFALTEPDAGSDVASLALRAVPDGDGFRLSGEKAFISNAPDADIYSVFARTSDAGSRGITAFAVPRRSEGLFGERITMISPHPIGRLVFNNVYVPA